jgi:uncharacterized protein with PIN domain
MKLVKSRMCHSCGGMLMDTEDYKLHQVSFDANGNAMYELICPHCGKVFWEYPWNIRYEEFSD